MQSTLRARIKKHIPLYIFMLPAIAFYIVFLRGNKLGYWQRNGIIQKHYSHQLA